MNTACRWKKVLDVIIDSNESKLDANGKFLKGPNYWKPEPKSKALLEKSGVKAARL